MALVAPDCFKALSQQEQAGEIYEAVLTWAVSNGKDTSTLAPADCFMSLANYDQVQQIYAALFLLAS
jgi:hypothetical protein